MEPSKVLLDTDVIVNWLTKEIETVSNKELWKAPYEIIKFIEAKKLSGIISITTLLEIRFLLRRKKKYGLKYRNFNTEIASPEPALSGKTRFFAGAQNDRSEGARNDSKAEVSLRGALATKQSNF